MKAKLTTLILFTLLVSMQTFAQDTLIIAKNYKYKFGVKIMPERSSADDRSDISYSTFYGGLQVTRKIKATKSSFESGIYYNSKAKEYSVSIYIPWAQVPQYVHNIYKVYYHHLSLPINYRLDTKSIYFSVGVFADYLLARTTDYDYFLSVDENYGTDRKFFIGYNLNLGIEKAVTYHLNIFAETRLAVTVSSAKTDGGFILTTGNDGNVGASNVSIGFGMGINYKLLRKLN